MQQTAALQEDEKGKNHEAHSKRAAETISGAPYEDIIWSIFTSYIKVRLRFLL